MQGSQRTWQPKPAYFRCFKHSVTTNDVLPNSCSECRILCTFTSRFLSERTPSALRSHSIITPRFWLFNNISIASANAPAVGQHLSQDAPWSHTQHVMSDNYVVSVTKWYLNPCVLTNSLDVLSRTCLQQYLSTEPVDFLVITQKSTTLRTSPEPSTDSEEFPPPPPPISEADFPDDISERGAPMHHSNEPGSGQYNVQTAQNNGSGQPVLSVIQVGQGHANAIKSSKPCLSTFQQLPDNPSGCVDTAGSGTCGVSQEHLRPLPSSNLTPAKSALAKRKRKKGHRPPKRVTFCENIALIVEKDDVSSEIDYVAYVSQILTKKTPPPVVSSKPCSSSTEDCLPPVMVEPKCSTGYDSDFDEDTSDSDTEPTGQADSERVRCSLCRKKLIEVSSIYCEDCSYYMAKFQSPSS